MRNLSIRKSILGCILVSIGILALAGRVSAASLSVTPATGSFPLGKTISAKVELDSEGAPVNASEGKITFDPSKLSVQSISKDGSAFSLWAVEPAFSNTDGTITFSGGTPSPFTGKKSIITIIFSPKVQGDASVVLESGNVLAADGLGTDVLKGKNGATYTITEAAVAPPPAEKPPSGTTQTGRTPGSPKLTSSSHPDETIWYSTRKISIEWDLPFGITGVRFGLVLDEAEEPAETFIPPIADTELSEIEDGTWFARVQFQNKNGWGEIETKKILIDGTPPEPFELSGTGGDLEFTLTLGEIRDALSGLARYEVVIDDGAPVGIGLDDIENGTYTAVGAEPGDHTIVFRAYDKAGNVTEASVDITVTGTIAPVGGVVEDTGPGVFGPIYWVTIVFVLLLAVLGGILIFERKKTREEKDHIKSEANEARERLELIFSVLRDEMEEQIMKLARKPNMTDTEREVLEDLKEALELSEELLDKEIEDIRKLLK